jgi:surface carbohydrate biosynthesis protein
MNIYIPIEIKARELEGRMLLALVAAEKGHHVILGEKSDTAVLAQKGFLPPGIVHDKSLTPGDYKFKYYRNLKKHGHLITAQDEESGLLDETYDRFASIRFSEEIFSLADKYFAWGDYDAKSLYKTYPGFKDRIAKTGSPRVDFWRKDFDRYFQRKHENEKPYIFVASNFGSPIDKNTFWDRMARLREAGYLERDPTFEKHLYENSAYQFRLLYRFVEMIRHLSDAFPDVTILVRPHPVESTDAWEKIIGDYPNVKVKLEGTISGWIRNSAVLIHNGCTSAMEAAVSKVPRIAYRPIPHEIERDIPNNVSLQAFGLDELSKMVSDILEDGVTTGFEQTEERASDILSNRLDSLNKSLAADKIVEEWTKLGNESGLNSSELDILLELKTAQKPGLKLQVKRKAVKLRDMIFSPQGKTVKNGRLLKTTHKFPSLEPEEVQEIHLNLKRTLGRFDNIKTVRFGKKSYIFYPAT